MSRTRPKAAGGSRTSVSAPCRVERYDCPVSKIRPSRRASSFTESVIREMTRLSMAHGAINLSQGYPDFAAPEDVKQTARFLGRWRRIAPRQAISTVDVNRERLEFLG
jgi:hypothetical protein